jgi:phosphopantetheinyl transferase (holo-ACP synthase)
MRIVRPCLLVLCFVVSLASFAQKEDWLPVTPQDLQYKEVPGNKGASAVRLYYAQYINDNTASCFFYERIKILNEKALAGGNSYADVQIPILTFGDAVEEISDLKARTIKPDGSIVEFNGKVFDKVIFKGRGIKFSARAFTMPEVSVGSIIEYKYRTILNIPVLMDLKIPVRNAWEIQSELFTVKESLYYQPDTGKRFQSMSQVQIESGGERLSNVMLNMKELKEKMRDNGGDKALDLTNVQPFESEEFMPPENNFKPTVIFFTGRLGKVDVDKEWLDIGKTYFDFYERLMAADHGVKEAAIKAIGTETDPAMKLHKIYDRVQQLRNLSFERSRTAEERKAEHIQKNNNVADVLAHGYGNSEELTVLFVAMARSAGFDASVVMVPDRKRQFFVRDWTSRFQIDNRIAAVNLNGKDMYLEPGTRFCPYGFVRWNHTEIDALKLDRKGGTFVKAPSMSYDKSVTRRNATMTLSEDGSLKGNIVLEFKGAEALEHRLDGIDRDEAGRKKDLEDELKQWLPAGSLVKMDVAQGWETSDTSLAARFNVEVPNYATLAGKRLLIPAFLFQSKENQAFAHGQRKYPIYFPYPFTDNDTVILQVPTGLTPESIPQKEDAQLPFARYQNVSNFDGTKLISQRQLAFNGIFFPVEKYSDLKTFFGKVQAGDEQQAVLHGGSTSAQKGS